MIVDSSALLALLWDEPEASRIGPVLRAATARYISTVTWVEALMVAEGRQGAAASRALLLAIADLELVPIAFGREHMIEALAAWQRFGKGRHPAALNLCDCCAYATAVVSGEPLLFKGNDFALTDVPAVHW